MIKVQLGTPKNEGFYEIQVLMIKLRNGVPDQELFDKEFIGKIKVDITHNGAQIKQKMIEFYETKTGEKLDSSQVMLRNPNYDIG